MDKVCRLNSQITEITEMNDRKVRDCRGTIFYDGTCRTCRQWALRLRPWMESKSIAVLPFEKGAEEAEMRVYWYDGRVFGGAEALRFLAWQFCYTAPLAITAGLPGLRQLTDAVYRFIAKRRHCLHSRCAVAIERPGDNWVGWTILAVLVGAATLVGLLSPVSPWLWMWMLAGALWVGFKSMNFRLEGGFGMVSPLFFAWIGTNAKPFGDKGKADRVRGQLASSLAFLAIGLGILLGFLPLFDHPVILGWLGIVAMLCLFHFGLFAILARIWNRVGFGVKPIMDAPWVAGSPAEFWGSRWNRAFSDWARPWIFRPLVRKFGIAGGTLAGFLASGIAHELIISLPARGGFGLPTVYFCIQATGVLAHRKFPFFRGWFYTLGTVLIPAPILFHPRFIERVFAPMVDALLKVING